MPKHCYDNVVWGSVKFTIVNQIGNWKGCGCGTNTPNRRVNGFLDGGFVLWYFEIEDADFEH